MRISEAAAIAGFQVTGTNTEAAFTLKLHRGEGMLLVAMDWKDAEPPRELVGFAIEYREPGGDRFFALKNRIAFPGPSGAVNPNRMSTRLSPIQKFRWVHFPRNADLAGEFTYRVTPVFMNDANELSYGDAQDAAIELRRETYPGELNVTFTRGFVSSQAFVDKFVTGDHDLRSLIPPKADEGLDFVPSHPKADDALRWMGFEARDAILEVLDQAVNDPVARVDVVAYDLCEPAVVSRLEALGDRLRVVIDNSGSHGDDDSAESRAATILETSGASVKRHHMNQLQHNKTIVVDGPDLKVAVCGSTNFTWRGFFVQSNNALVVRGEEAIQPFVTAAEAYWEHDSVSGFGKTASAEWTSLGFPDITAKVAFSPHAPENALLDEIAEDIRERTRSCLFYSLAFLYQTEGPIRDAIEEVTKRDDIFVYGISDRRVRGGLDIQLPDGNVAPVRPAALTKNVPEPFKSEPTGLAGGVGNRMHHKFVVIDFDRPSARVYLGSYNFSNPADVKNGENLLLIRDRRIATSYAIEALRIFDHYHFRVAQEQRKKAKKKLTLRLPPRDPEDEPWWAEDYTDARKVRDRELFA
jgi:phosphatidylserine/phosphatidylglycerophosphate/cardiolipin synthase-like enzyme